jgi:predicted MPP superfamily phosphohydrolase
MRNCELLYQSMRVSRRALLKTVAATGIGAATGVASYGYFWERHALVTARAELMVHRLPTALAGFRIGLLTDVHRGEWMSAADVAAAVERLQAEKPDLIVLGGDYITWGERRFVGPAAEALSPLSAPQGVFAVLGNHDDDRYMPAELERRHIDVLRDARTDITIRGERVSLVGVRFWTRRAQDIASLLKGATGFPVLLSHDPRRLTEATALKIPLVLSGHTHGGQVVLPVVGALAAQRFPVVAGIGRLEETTMFVSRGIGTVFIPIRMNCPPEVAVLTLRQASSPLTSARWRSARPRSLVI